jgi:UDP-N-acetylglucosamine 4,6-dehydratase/5-epimerase
MLGGEIYVKKIPSMRVSDIALAVDPGAKHNIIGIRPGEKLHEQMISQEDAAHTYEYNQHFKILPAIHNWSQDPERINDGKPVASDFSYCSDNNDDWMSAGELQKWIAANRDKIGKI